MSNWNESLEEWKQLNKLGRFDEADALYFEKLFAMVIERFVAANEMRRDNEALISLLGFSQEPIILSAKAIQPSHHVVLVTSRDIDTRRIKEYLQPEPQFRELRRDESQTLYSLLKEVIVEFPTHNITIDITGGKKSMVAVASIFARDYGCRLIYVDTSVYLKDLRKPEPGAEILQTVYQGMGEVN